MQIPVISVIIPMYNAEKYIGDCLNSILNQTFQDFEVIVIDDCSTDNSVSVVESYVDKFNGRLTFTRTKKNSGGGGYVPRNRGLSLSRGEYIFFVDADDFIIKTALEVLHTAATQVEADVVYTSSYYLCSDDEKFALIMDGEESLAQQKGLKSSITLIQDSSNRNLQKLLLESGFFHTPWTKFVRRDFLINNKIEFPKIISGGDFIWTIQVLYYAKKLLRLPVALYFYRNNVSSSVTRQKRALNEQIITCIRAFLLGTKALQDLSNRIDLLKQNPHYFKAAVEPFFINCLNRTFKERMHLDSQDFYEILYRGFGKDSDSIVPFLFTAIDEQQKELLIANHRLAELEDKLKSKS